MDGENPLSPEELGIPSGDYEQPIAENQPESEQVERDSKRETFLAEDIAQFRTDMEQKIFFDRLPRNQWKEAYEETLAANPQIHPYKDIFDDVLESTERAHDELEVFWNQHQGQEDQQVGEPTRPEVSNKLFESIFGFYPKGEVKASKGIISLNVEVDDDVFKQINKSAGRADDPDENAFVIHSTDYRTFPVMVSRKNQSEGDSFFTEAHEFEHVKTDVLGTGRKYFKAKQRRLNLIAPERLTLPKAIADRIERRNKSASPIENAAKDEILAYFTEPEWIAFPSESKLTQYLELYSEEIKHKLTDKDNTYLSKYKERFKPTLEEEKSYLENVKKGTDSSVQLFNLYFSTSKNSRGATRMAINVLEQFPLHSWPAIVRLLKTRHKDKNSQV